MPRTVPGVLERLRLVARLGGELQNEVPGLISRLQRTATAEHVPALFDVLEDDDTQGVSWAVFFILEGFDDDYLRGLLDALPALWNRAPSWVQTSLIRVLNTRGDDDDCTAEFERMAKAKNKSTRELVLDILKQIAVDAEGELAEDQQQSVAQAISAISGRSVWPAPEARG